MSRWMKFLEWMYSILCNYPLALSATIWSASISTVFRLNFRFRWENKSSKLDPNKSITITV